ncbi:hypothetical protein [Streptomyces carpaticus]|uniref:hypothetical protein n=1 Tax=Streptomyces carpaticus TaxID=285558 RepID=UPI0031F80C09
MADADWLDELYDQGGAVRDWPASGPPPQWVRIPPPGQTVPLGQAPQPSTPAPVTAPADPEDEEDLYEEPEGGEDELAAAVRQLGDRLVAAQQPEPQPSGTARRARWLAYEGSAAAAGHIIPWAFGADFSLPLFVTDLMVTAAAQPGAHWINGLAVGGLCMAFAWVAAERPLRRPVLSVDVPDWRRSWRPPVGWILRIPFASAALGVLLWTPAWTTSL